ncbi:arsenate reductase/protein-tyrosine-phosphatase family protein [Caulobacter sp. LARHSG274]
MAVRRIQGSSNQNRKPLLASRRSTLLAFLLLPPGLAFASCPPSKVLFVCPAGTVKSAIAREALKQRAASVGAAILVRSRGLAVEDHVSAALAARLAADGLDPRAEIARTLEAPDVAWADIVVAFDEASQAPTLARARSWTTPSWNSDYDNAKADLDRRLDALLAELAKQPCS